ncbi:cap-specific mRNA (nucleoside-2'-O-)-methyltransferase 1 isoform X2 [Parasteatoda tepidariorum]|uniref:cap-specific mRNA (nucleoside-2'-O-)-methyltransferase 1 isoform X2 n=1 Tax=Parasteatoda tepidariorum TaxID=114398 RepID=UPI001C71BE0A|nr:cap-specific mRNA (nucleoside-2'-O-)-methyltransferase 1 isoform X2 [Parasteatoda tepidariorum]
MNKFKSLSDSSTSESEEDYGKRLQNQLQFDKNSLKRSLSTDDTEDEPDLTAFKSPYKYAERLSTDDTEDEHLDTVELPPNKKMMLGFKNPSHYVERDISDSSESEEKSTPVSFGSDMPSMDALNGNYGVGMKIMSKMGYKSGTGLGKFAQGRVNIVEASQQRGRRGLGLKMKAGLEPAAILWESGQDEMISVEEEVTWIPDINFPTVSIKELREWMTEGNKIDKIDDETEFVDPTILKKIIDYKSIFDELEPEEMRKARTRSNPFETIRGGIFLNRAAMKMANMDAMFDFMFSQPKKMNGESLIENNELLYFADVCAGPGGFSEYVLWRKKWEAKGFGFTLRGSNDFKLEDFFSGPPESFEPYYGVNEDGNVYAPENLRSFSKYVYENTENKGVHFMMADGGFSVEGKENEQEILSKRLYLCQFLCALMIVRPEGHFVCKLFDLFTTFSVGLVYLMCMCYEKVCIFKPNTSRPANSERYIVCKWKKENTKDICDYLYEVNEYFNKLSDFSEVDISEVVPLNILKQNEEFYDYICESNNKFGERQIIHLDKIRVFAQNSELREERQPDLRKECLEHWQVPDEVRKAPARPEASKRYEQLLQGENLKYLSSSPEILTTSSFKKLEQVFDFYCVICGDCKPDQHPTLFLGLGRSSSYRYDSKSCKWLKLEEKLDLPADTLFYGELILELKGEGRAQRKITCLHIFDAMYLGGKDVRNFHFQDRLSLAEKFVKAISKPSKSDYTKLRVKEAWQLPDIEQIFQRLSMKFIKNAPVPRLCFDLGDGRHILPTGLLIFKTTAEPWITAFSKTNQRQYLFNTRRNVSSFERTDAANANFQSCFSKRILWNWERGVRLIPEQNVDCQNNLVHGHILLEFLNNRLNKLMGRQR